MTLELLFADKAIKAKAKVTQVGEWLLNKQLQPAALIAFAETRKASGKASCIEAIEYATKKMPELADEGVWEYITQTLEDQEPRVKWESAKVIGNIAKLFPTHLEKPVQNLLANAKSPGTVVRWATAYALAEILKLKTDSNKKLLPEGEILCEQEEGNGVKKKYLDALKKVKQQMNTRRLLSVNKKPTIPCQRNEK